MPHRLSLRGGSVLVSAWLLWAHLCGLAAISLGLGYVLLLAFATDGPVVELLRPPYPDPKTGETITENPRAVTHRVVQGGPLRFTVDFARHESCPGTVIETFRSADLRSVVVQRRPALSNRVGSYYGVAVTTSVPPAVFPGRWLYEQTVDSEGCPGGKRGQPDPFARFEFEVTADGGQ